MVSPLAGKTRYVLNHLSADSRWGRLHIFWLALVAVAFTGIGTAYVLFYLRVQAQENGQRLSESFAMVIEEQTSRTLQTVDLGLQLTSQKLGQLQAQGLLSQETASDVLRQGLAQMPFTNELVVVDASGHLKYQSNAKGIGISLADRSYFQHYLNHPDTLFHLGPLVLGRTIGQWSLTAAWPMPTTTPGKFNGIVVAGINPQYFSEQWSRLELGTPGSITLFNRDGQLLMRSPANDAALGKYFPNLTLFTDQLPQRPKGSFKGANVFDNVSRLITYQTVDLHPELVVAVGVPYAQILGPWNQLAITTTAIWASASAAILILCFFLNSAWALKTGNESKLKKLAERFALSTDAAGVGVWDWQIDSDTWYASPPYYTQLGYEPEEGQGDRKQWLNRVHPDDRAAIAEKIESALKKSSETYQYEARVLHANGEYRWVSVLGRVLERDAKGAPLRLMGIRLDITERKQTEQALQHSKAFGLAILDAVTAEIVVLNPQGIIVAVNAPWQRFALEHSSPSARPAVKIGVGENYFDACQTERTEDSEGGVDALVGIRAVLSGSAPHFSMEYPCHSPTQQCWFQMSVTPLGSAGEGAVVAHIDITKRKAQEALLILSERVFAQSLEGIVVTDPRGFVVSINEAFTEISGYTLDDILGQRPTQFSSKRHTEEFHAALNAAVAAHGTWQGEIWIRSKGGSEHPLWVKVSVVRDDKGRLCNFVGLVSDMSEQKANQEKINWLSHFNPISGLPNRLLLQDRTAHTLSIVERSSQPLCMMMIGMGQLKAVNDTRGHPTADKLLQQVAERLTQAAREQDTIGHLGGREFVLVLPNTPADGGAHFATKLQWKLAQPYTVDSEEFTLTVAIGISTFPDNGSDFNTLIRAAELAMHRAQTAGPNTFQFYSESIYQNIIAQDQLTKALRTAIAMSQLHVVYQPLADMQTGQISGMEALLRWNHPQLGAVSPVQFIPLAEESGLIKEIGEWVLRQACKDIQAWQNKGILVPPVAVNVSPIQFRESDFAVRVQKALSDFHVDPSRIYLEVTESALMEDVDRSENLLTTLKAMGIGLSLDDFGTGYSSLSYLKRFPFNKVKIDQSFVRDIGSNRTDVVIVQVIVSMAHGLGLKVVAEGVETESQCEIMRNSVCDEIQGYLFSRPVPAATIEDLIRQPLQLPSNLLRFRKPKRTLLLVDDEANVIASLKRLFRKDGHTILSASSGAEGLEILAQNKVDVIISDQRMPGMTGVEFLRAAKASYPDTIRIVLSGYTELQSVTDAINEGAIYRFLTKPWEDEQLRDHIRRAFEYKELQEENQQLGIKIRTTNQELVSANMQLNAVLEKTRSQIVRDENTLAILREALECAPMPIVGVDEEGVVAFVNDAADQLLREHGPLLGEDFATQLPTISEALEQLKANQIHTLQLGRQVIQMSWSPMGAHSVSRGKLITFLPKETA
jgi:diguanylate cyclase (GGDEF)-like protein/PAS domain S-box-containing protein